MVRKTLQDIKINDMLVKKAKWETKQKHKHDEEEEKDEIYKMENSIFLFFSSKYDSWVAKSNDGVLQLTLKLTWNSNINKIMNENDISFQILHVYCNP